jgi:four helix bundle protein
MKLWRHIANLIVWQTALDLAQAVYRVTSGFPKSEPYGLTSQIKQAAISISANIAEGHDRESTQEFLNHLSFALGSLAELETLLVLAARLQYLTNDTCGRYETDFHSIGKTSQKFFVNASAAERKRHDRYSLSSVLRPPFSAL